MIAVDTSSLVAFNAGESGKDINQLVQSLQGGLIVLPPTVLSEMLSDPKLPSKIEKQLLKIPVLEIQPGYWERVGYLRKKLIQKRLKARLADTQIAQSCLDANVPLITRDADFKKYKAHAKLELMV